MTNDTQKALEDLKDCPFCQAGETVIDEKGYWTGQRTEITHVEIRHWCNKGTIEGAYLTIKGKTLESAIERWNTRAVLQEDKPCPFVHTDKEGTSFCKLAEGQAALQGEVGESDVANIIKKASDSDGDQYISSSFYTVDGKCAGIAKAIRPYLRTAQPTITPDMVERGARGIHKVRKGHEAFDYEDEDIDYAEACLQAALKEE